MPNPTEVHRLRSDLAALREAAEKHALLIETTDKGFVILDEAGRVLDANPAYVKLSGHERLEQILGRPVTDWTVPEDIERNAADARARRQTEEALRGSEQRYRATIDSMGEAIHVVDADLRIELLNRTGEDWFRRLGIKGDIVGRRVFEIFPFLPESVREEYRRVFAGEGPLITHEVNSVTGSEVATETRKIPIVQGGRVASVVTVIRDVTDAVRAQEKLRQTEKLDALGQLTSGIAHDFNNQLAAVMGYAELLAAQVEEPQHREYAALIMHVARHSADLTRKLLAFARKGRVRSVPTDVHALIREVVAILGRTIDPRVAIRLRLQAEHAVVTGDPAQLQNALLNLALNARDAMPDGGELTFATDGTTAPEGGALLRIRVVDTGTGMSEEVRRRLFEPFFTTKGPGHGTGMGLPAVYGTISEHQGTIHVDSEPGRGSTFTLVLPLATGHRTVASPTPVERSIKGQGHVLVADDAPAVLRMMCDGLTSLGYRVTAHHDGAAALDWYRESWRDVDIVLLDVMMPTLDGPGALVEMRRINPGIRAILASGHPPGPGEQRLIDEMGVGFLQKPFTMAELSRCTASMLGAAQDGGAPGPRLPHA